MHTPRTQTSSWGPILSLLLATTIVPGCYVGISDPSAGNSGQYDAESAGEDETAGGDGESDGADADGWEPPPLADTTPVSPVSRLTRREYIQTVDSAPGFGPLSEASLPNDGHDGIFAMNGKENFGDYSGYVQAADELATGVSEELAASCDWLNAVESCIETQIVPTATIIYRGEPTAADIEELGQLFEAVYAETENVEVAASATLFRALLDDRFLFHRELGEQPGTTPEAMLLSGPELASRISYYLHDAPADGDLFADAVSGQLVADLEVRREHATRLVDDPRTRQKMWEFVAAWLNIPAQPPASSDPDPAPDPGSDPGSDPDPVDECDFTQDCKEIHGPEATDCVDSQSEQSWCSCGGVPCTQSAVAKPHTTIQNRPRPSASLSADVALSMYEETRRFVDYVLFDGDVPLRDLLSANYSFIDATLAEHYGVPAPEQDWELYTFPDSAQRRGILTHASFLSSNAGHEHDVSWIFRGKIVLGRMFCIELPAPPPDAIETEVESRETAPACSGCHSIMDPIGRIFDNYDDTGAVRTDGEAGGDINIGGDIDGDYADAVEFAEEAGESLAVTNCLAKMLFRHALGRDAVAVDTPSFEALRSSLTDASFKEAVIELLTSDAFATVYIDPSNQVCE